MAIDERAVGAGPDEYERILADYVRQPSEEALYRVSLLSQGLIESGLGPEDIIALHFEALDRLTDLAVHSGFSAPHLALNWVLRQTDIAVVLIGATRTEPGAPQEMLNRRRSGSHAVFCG